MDEQCFEDMLVNNEAKLIRMFSTSEKDLFNYGLKSLKLNYINYLKDLKFVTTKEEIVFYVLFKSQLVKIII